VSDEAVIGEPQPRSAPGEEPEVVGASLAAWKVLLALVLLGTVVGGFLAIFGHSLRLFH
jgi:hypothetical protein